MNKTKYASTDCRFVIGIDLGTTESALSYVDLSENNPKIRAIPVMQPVAKGQIEQLPTLPSVIYIDEAAGEDSNDVEPKLVFGAYARELGSEVPARLVHSSKSWLSHPRADRTAPILPWQSEIVKNKISPLEASSQYLKYLIEIWNSTIGKADESHSFERQKVVVTIPASFDPSARNYTIEAIKKVTSNHVLLLEEPQAAFYDYLYRNSELVSDELKGLKVVLVVDIGGGTTDFSLIAITQNESHKPLEFSRMAVGPHLLIGGDNLDMALARKVEALFRHKGHKIAVKQWQSLLHQCKEIKEKIFSGNLKEKAVFNIVGTGRKILSGSAKVELEVSEIIDFLTDGFFPVVGAQELPQDTSAIGVSEVGLPYTREVAITKHLAAFLKDNNILPDAVLFNGGTMKADSLRIRLMEVIALWKGSGVHLLQNPDLTIAVARGAVCYGMASIGLAQRITSGSPVSIYLGVGDSSASTPEKHVPKEIVCLLQKNSEPEKEYHLKGKTFGIDLSRDSAFYLYYTTSPSKTEQIGRQIRFNSKKYLPLPPCILAASTGLKEKQVTLKVKMCETGYLDMYCEEIDGSFKRSLSFDIASFDKAKKESETSLPLSTSLNKAQIKKIDKLLSESFVSEEAGNKTFKELEQILATPRNTWNAQSLRSIFDIALKYETDYLASTEGLTAYFRLIGFCLRPGYGVVDDIKRVDYIWSLLDKSFDFSNSQLASEWWIMWKRIAPGLSIERQEYLKNSFYSLLFPSKKDSRDKRKISQHEKNQIWRLLAHLERLSPLEKERLVSMIVAAPLSYGKDMVAMYALGRIGARELAYAPDTMMVSNSKAGEWAQHLLNRSKPGNSYIDWALRELAKKTGDRLVQIDDRLRNATIELLKFKKYKKSFLLPLLEVKGFDEDSLAQFTGESLPSGFLWVKDQ